MKNISINNLLLTEKYRPTDLNHVLGNEGIIKLIKNLSSDFPHLLLCGPPGTGKTTISKIIAKQFEKVLELNASDERGIDVVRTRIKTFTMLQSNSKLIILDECDNLTAAAQQALRRIMEITDSKFILICNVPSKIIEPIQSRTAILKFEKIPLNRERIYEICKAEGIVLSEGGMKALSDLSGGDLRSALNILQGIISIGKSFVVDDKFLYSINGVPHRNKLKQIIEAVKKKDEEDLISSFEEIYSQKYESSEILNGLFKIAKDEDNYEFLAIIGKYQLRITGGDISKIQFYGMFYEMINGEEI
ncbi:hypothetical protein NUSPORA_02339 [Nucleospora cyclopteri]